MTAFLHKLHAVQIPFHQQDLNIAKSLKILLAFTTLGLILCVSPTAAVLAQGQLTQEKLEEMHRQLLEDFQAVQGDDAKGSKAVRSESKPKSVGKPKSAGKPKSQTSQAPQIEEPPVKQEKQKEEKTLIERFIAGLFYILGGLGMIYVSYKLYCWFLGGETGCLWMIFVILSTCPLLFVPLFGLLLIGAGLQTWGIDLGIDTSFLN